MCHGLVLMSSSPRLAQHSKGERQPAMSILFAKNKNGIRLSFTSVGPHRSRGSPQRSPRHRATARGAGWGGAGRGGAPAWASRSSSSFLATQTRSLSLQSITKMMACSSGSSERKPVG